MISGVTLNMRPSNYFPCVSQPGVFVYLQDFCRDKGDSARADKVGIVVVVVVVVVVVAVSVDVVVVSVVVVVW